MDLCNVPSRHRLTQCENICAVFKRPERSVVRVAPFVAAVWVIGPHDRPGLVYAATLSVIMVSAAVRGRRRQLT